MCVSFLGSRSFASVLTAGHSRLIFCLNDLANQIASFVSADVKDGNAVNGS